MTCYDVVRHTAGGIPLQRMHFAKMGQRTSMLNALLGWGGYLM